MGPGYEKDAETKFQKTCPECGKSYETYPSKDRKYCSNECYLQHTTKEKICPICEDSFRTPQSVDKTYCGEDCAREAFRNGRHVATGSDSNFWQGGSEELICENCGDTFSVPPSRAGWRKFCDKECMAEAYSDGRLKKENHPNWKGGLVELSCSWCDSKFSVIPSQEDSARFCSRDCVSEWLIGRFTGPQHPNWEGGRTRYGKNWDEQRQKALERDDYQCVVCGRDESDLRREPDVHHIVPIREFDEPTEANSLSNLVTLCQKHHLQVEGWNLLPENVGRKIIKSTG